MKKQKIKIGVIALLSLIIIFEGVYIFHQHSARVSGMADESERITAVPTEKTQETEEPVSAAAEDPIAAAPTAAAGTRTDTKKIVVLDPGHGKSSGQMSADEKIAAGYVQQNGAWGEWRHWKNGTSDQDCNGSGCNGDYSCWYPIGNGDRATEPEINLKNALAAKEILEKEYGYEVRMTRTSNDENPSFSKRVSYCYPNQELSGTPDASCYVCIHSNAGGGSGSAYIEAGGNYTQKLAPGLNSADFSSASNQLGAMINARIVSQTSLSQHGAGVIKEEGYLILFNKCPVPAGYLEIGFFDNSSDLSVLNSESDKIGNAIAEGIHDFVESSR